MSIPVETADHPVSPYLAYGQESRLQAVSLNGMGNHFHMLIELSPARP